MLSFSSLFMIIVFIGLYCLSVLCLLSSVSFLVVYLFLEVSLFLTLYVVYVGCGGIDCLVVYFFVNLVSSFFLLWGSMFLAEIFFLLGLVVKVGFFPFLWWFPFLADRFNYSVLFFMGGVVKLVPVFMFFNSIISVGVGFFFVVMVTVSMSLVEMFLVLKSLKVYLIWSSKVNLSWVLFLLCWFWDCGLLYYFVYLMLFGLVCNMLGENMLFVDQMCFVGSFGVFMLILCFFSFSGFPPFLGFFYKYVIYYMLSMWGYSGGLVVFWLLLVFSLLMLVSIFLYLVVFVKFVFLFDVFVSGGGVWWVVVVLILYVFVGLFVLMF